MVGALGIGIIILEDYAVDPLVGTTRTGRYNRLTKHINKIGLGRATVSIRHKQGFKHYKLIDVGRKGIMP